MKEVKGNHFNWLPAKRSLGPAHFVLLAGLLNFVLFHYPFYAFVFANADYKSWSGIGLIVSLIILMPVAYALAFYIIFFISRRVGKALMAFFLLPVPLPFILLLPMAL